MNQVAAMEEGTDTKMKKYYYWEDCVMADGSCTRIHLLWWKKQDDLVETDKEDCQPK